MEPKSLVFHPDRPTSEDELGTHRDIARLLLEIVNSSSDNPLVVGLFGRWGTGKSSVIDMYDDLLLKSKIDVTNIRVDAWAYANAKERFAPGLLGRMADTLLKSQRLAKKIKAELEKQTETWQVEPDLDTAAKVAFVLLMLVVIGLGVSLLVATEIPTQKITLVLFIVSTVIVNGLLSFYLPRTATNKQTKILVGAHNSVEHFRKCLQKILRCSRQKKISVVIDNLDRTHPADALEIIRLLKSFIVEDEWFNKHDRRLVFIIPCDRYELANHLSKTEFVSSPHDFLRKLFNLSVTIPELVHQDLYSFVRRHLAKVIDGRFEFKPADFGNLVFILTQASLKSPRQAKTLINDFIGYWRGLEIAGLASARVSPAAAAFFVGVNSLSDEPVLTADDMGRLGESASSKSNHPDRLVWQFLRVTKPFQRDITRNVWQHLGRSRISQDEIAIPELWEIRDAVLARDSRQLEELCDSYESKAAILAALDNQIVAEDQNSRIPLAWFALVLLERGDLTSDEISHSILDTTQEALEFHQTGSEFLIRSGLGKLLRAGRLRQMVVDATLRRLDIEDTKARAELKEKGGDAVGFLMEAIDDVSWGGSPETRRLLERVIYTWIGEDNKELLKAVLSRIDLIETEVAGIHLCDRLTAVAGEVLTNEVLTALETRLAENPTEGNAALLHQWIKLAPLKDLSDPPGAIRLTLILARHLHDRNDNIPDKHHPTQPEVTEFCNRLEAPFQGHLRTKSYSAAISVLIAFSLLAAWVGRKHGQVAERQLLTSIGTRMWEELAKVKLVDHPEAQALVGEYLDRYPDILLQPDVPNPPQLVNLTHNSNLNILERLAASAESGVLENVLSELVTSKGRAQHIADWISNLRSDDFSEDSGQALPLLFKVFRIKNPAPDVYQVVIEGVKRHKRRKAARNLAQKHMVEIIEGTIWRDKESIDLTVDKIRILEEIEQISEESTELIRKKMGDHNSSNLIAVVSDANRSWLRQKLVIES